MVNKLTFQFTFCQNFCLEVQVQMFTFLAVFVCLDFIVIVI
jgi:hypothetical protein